MRFSLRELFVAVTLCAVEAALVAAIPARPWAAIPAAVLGYYLLSAPVTTLFVWWRKSRMLPAPEAIALSTMALTYAIACLCLIVILLALIAAAAAVALIFIIGPR
jgi:hypothetical protein